MKNFPPTIVIRHIKENLKKCTLSGLEKRDDFRFFSYPSQCFSKYSFPIESYYILLTLDAPELTGQDRAHGLLILDGTWRYVQNMERTILFPPTLIRRSLSTSLQTAYPRRQYDCLDPNRGLASIEAIVAAYTVLGREREDLLDNYYWKESFLEKNAHFF